MVPWQGSAPPKVKPPAATTRLRPDGSSVATAVAGSAPDGPRGRPSPSSPATSFSMGLRLNGPDSPPVVYGGYELGSRGAAAAAFDDDDDEERCRNCHSAGLFTDWRQGDRVCTRCGVVAEGRLLDDRPEWKDFNEAEDIVKGLPSRARSGLVPVDEGRYIGGLQPTILSKNAFGENAGGYKLARIRKQLKSTNRRLDHLMQKGHQKALQDALLERKVRLRQARRRRGDHHDPFEIYDGDQSVRPEFDQIVLQEEEEAHRLHAALYADKWSLERALLLYGTTGDGPETGGEDREELLGRMDATLKKASQDLYLAYSMMTLAAQKLHLPERVMNEVVHRLVRYATRRDGFTVKGVSSRLSKDSETECKQELQEAAERLREYNKTKQMSSLGAAILFLTARNLGWTRTVNEICECFPPPRDVSHEKAFLKPKHCSRAVAEIKALFPEYARPPAGTKCRAGESHHRDAQNDSLSTSNFADHFIRRLKLPPVAEASVRVLLVHCRHEQQEWGQSGGTKLSTLCATVAYFVCTLGSVMQRVAQQVHSSNAVEQSSPARACPHPTGSRKRRRGEDRKAIEPAPPSRVVPKVKESSASLDGSDRLEPHVEAEDDAGADEEPFDAFTHPAIVENRSDTLEYEMRRMWDAWAEQMSWSRSLAEVEQSCGVSRTVIATLYKSELYPRRDALLGVLKESVTPGLSAGSRHAGCSSLLDTPQATILMAHISTAAALMNDK